MRYLSGIENTPHFDRKVFYHYYSDSDVTIPQYFGLLWIRIIIRDDGRCDSGAADNVAVVGRSNSATFQKCLQRHVINKKKHFLDWHRCNVSVATVE